MLITLQPAPPFPSSANSGALRGCQVGNIPGLSARVLPPGFLGPIGILGAAPPRTLQTLLGFLGRNSSPKGREESSWDGWMLIPPTQSPKPLAMLCPGVEIDQKD